MHYELFCFVVPPLQDDGPYVRAIEVHSLLVFLGSATNDHVNFVKIDVDASPKLSTEEKITVLLKCTFER